MQPTNVQSCWPVRLMDRSEARAILKEKFDNREHWLLVIHGSAAPLMIEIEQHYYSGEKNADFTVITCVHRGEVFGVIAAMKKHMLAYQLLSMLRQATDARLSERELLRRDLVIVAPGEVLVTAAMELANRLLSIADDDLAIAP
ncbi:MAG: hypothetical protein ACREBD_21935 [Blastocatellia bacterium]